MFSSQFCQCILLSETPWHLASLASPWRKYICILLTSFFCQHWKLHPVEPHLFVRPATINRKSSKITFSELMRDLSLRKVSFSLMGWWHSWVAARIGWRRGARLEPLRGPPASRPATRRPGPAPGVRATPGSSVSYLSATWMHVCLAEACCRGRLPPMQEWIFLFLIQILIKIM